ncbi:MAG TPA: hypothetical protein VMP08_13235 [Anaerolineae bacterium]|nr:hypothetical protein [Anaerolineae bacterium]
MLMKVFDFILLVLLGFISLYFPRFFLRRYKNLSSSELRDVAGLATMVRLYPWKQVLFASVSGVVLFTIGTLLWPIVGTRVYFLFGVWVALLGMFDGWFAAKTGIYPTPEKIGYFYVVGDGEYDRKLGKIHLWVGVTVAVVIIVWAILL